MKIITLHNAFSGHKIHVTSQSIGTIADMTWDKDRPERKSQITVHGRTVDLSESVNEVLSLVTAPDSTDLLLGEIINLLKSR